MSNFDNKISAQISTHDFVYLADNEAIYWHGHCLNCKTKIIFDRFNEIYHSIDNKGLSIKLLTCSEKIIKNLIE